MTSHSVHVFAGGREIPPDRTLDAGSPSLRIGADSGAELALASGIAVDVVVGDMDSISPSALAALEERGAEIRRHPVDKDATDLELALAHALDAGATAITVIGGGGGRLDHLLGNVAVIAALADHAAVTWILEEATGYVVVDSRTIETGVGATFGLVPIGGDAGGVTLTGARWPLADAHLRWGSSLGVSNEAVAPSIEVSVTSGTLLVIVDVRRDVPSTES